MKLKSADKYRVRKGIIFLEQNVYALSSLDEWSITSQTDYEDDWELRGTKESVESFLKLTGAKRVE